MSTSEPTKTPWVLVSSLNDNTSEQDLMRLSSEIKEMIDDWQSQGKIIWSGAFSNNKSSMAIFEATNDEAKTLYDRYDKICSGVLTYAMYQWDAMPILSLLSKN